MQSPRHAAFIFLAASLAPLGVAHCQGSPGIVSARATAILNHCDANLAKLRLMTLSVYARQSEQATARITELAAENVLLSRAANGNESLRFSDYPIASLVNPRPTGGRRNFHCVWNRNGTVEAFRAAHRLQEVSFSHRRSFFRRELCIGGGGAIAPVLGIFFGGMRRVTNVIRRSSKVIHISRKIVKIGKYVCLHVRASGSSGKYSLWIAPGFGYAIVRAVVRKEPGDEFLGRKLGSKPHAVPKGLHLPPEITQREVSFQFVLDQVKLTEKSGAWLPQRFRSQMRIRYVGGITDTTVLYGDVKKVSPTCNNHSPELKLNIPNGTPVWNEDRPTIQYIWKNGKVVPAHGKGGLKKPDGYIDGIR